MKASNVRVSVRAAIASAALVGLAGSASAVQVGFDVVSGDYNVATNWATQATGDPVGNFSGAPVVPTIAEDVRVSNGGTVTIGAGQPQAEGNTLRIGHGSLTTGTVNLDAGGSMKVQLDLFVAGNDTTDGSSNSRTGTMNQTGGTLTASNIAIGLGRSSVGTYNLSGGSITLDNVTTANTFFYVGSRRQAAGVLVNPTATATMNHSGGDLLLTDDVPDRVDLAVLRLGHTQTAVGSSAGTVLYNMTGGTVTAANLEYGTVDSGLAAGTGGTNTFSLGGTGLVTIKNLKVTNTSATNTFNFNGGTLRAAANSTWQSGLSAANVQAGGAKINTNGFNVAWSQPLAHDTALGATADGGLTKSGAGTLTLAGAHTFTGGTNVTAGTLELSKMHANNAVNIAEGAKLRILDSARTLPAHPAGDNAFVSQPKSLTIAAGGTLDIGNNDVVIDYTGGPNPAADLEALVRSGFAGETWAGTGIVSSVAAQDPNYVVGIADNAALSEPFGTGGTGVLFSGVNVPLNSVLIKFTHRADLNLDGQVNFSDASIFGTNYQEGQPATWALGDVDLDGVFTFSDASIFGTFYAESLASLPEPASLGLLGLGLMGLARRRR